jgi:hypothetical protein
MGRRRSSVHASLDPRGDGDALAWRRSDVNLGQSVRTLWSEEDQTRREMVLEKAVVKDMGAKVRPHVLVRKQHGFLG